MVRAVQRAAMAQAQRLRAGFGLNYAAIGLVADLLDRIAELKLSARRNSSAPEAPWTRTN